MIENEGIVGTTFRDVVTLALAGFMAVIILVLPWVNPPGKKQESVTVPPGDIVFESTWPKDLNTDVDQWVAAPGDVPVGYSNLSGVSCNLLRDDLGHFSDPLEINHEITACRGLFTHGEYTMNLHLYRNTSAVLPIPVSIKISVKTPTEDGGKTAAKELIRTHVQLKRVGQELTVVRFKLREDGSLVEDSVHSLFRPLRNYGS